MILGYVCENYLSIQCQSFKEELFLQKIVLLGLIDLFHNDFSIPQIPRGPLSLSLSLSLSVSFLFYNFTENIVPFLKNGFPILGKNHRNWLGFGYISSDLVKISLNLVNISPHLTSQAKFLSHQIWQSLSLSLVRLGGLGFGEGNPPLYPPASVLVGGDQIWIGQNMCQIWSVPQFLVGSRHP